MSKQSLWGAAAAAAALSVESGLSNVNGGVRQSTTAALPGTIHPETSLKNDTDASACERARVGGRARGQDVTSPRNCCLVFSTNQDKKPPNGGVDHKGEGLGE